MKSPGHPVSRPLVGVLAAIALAMSLAACSLGASTSAPSAPGTPAAGGPAALPTPAASAAIEPSASAPATPAQASAVPQGTDDRYAPAPTSAPSATAKPGPTLAPAPTPTRTPRPTAAPTATPAPTSSALVAARIVDFAFSPQTLTVARGSSVRWTNADVAPHTVTAGDGSFASGTLAQNAAFTRAFPTAGTFAYLCAIHPSMTGTVVVTP